MRAAVAFGLLVSLALSSCKKKEEEAVVKPPAVPPVSVPLVTAHEQDTPEVLTLTGVIAANQRSEVTADTQGKVLAVMVERGQRVKMGQSVVKLDVRTAALSAREAQANLESARAQKQLAEEECKRTQTLLDKGAITRSEYDRQATQCTSTLQQVSAAQARADMITKSINDGEVRAPFAGLVTEKSVAPGEWVAPGRTLFTLVDDQVLRIELSVPEAAVRAVSLDQEVILEAVAQPGKTYTARVKRIGGEIAKNRALIVEAQLDPQKDLVPGMFAEAHLVIGHAKRPVVPSAAVVRRGKAFHTFVVIDGELQERIVQTGPALSDGTLPVLQGVQPGDRVVADAKNPALSDGLRVVDPEAKPAAPDAKAAKPDVKAEAKPDVKAEAK